MPYRIGSVVFQKGNAMIVRYRLMSKRDGAADWGIRNDRYHMGDHNRKNWTEQDALDKARREKAGWENIESSTQFRIEQTTDNGRTWTELPRWA